MTHFLSSFVNVDTDGLYSVSADQGSRFAKDVAGDFNPIHDADSKRFCVPGDLLFATALQRYGVYQRMSFRFLDMVAADSRLVYPQSAANGQVFINKESGKPVLEFDYQGQCACGAAHTEMICRQYVAFSGQNFPHILVPLMQEHGVMINTKRPLVIYESMSFELQRLDFSELQLSLVKTTLDVQGKRGNAFLHFRFADNHGEIGVGQKKLVLSGLRDYNPDAIQGLCDDFLKTQQAYNEKRNNTEKSVRRV